MPQTKGSPTMLQIPPAERDATSRAGLIAAGVADDRIEAFSTITDQIIARESAWNRDACAIDSSWRGPRKLFGHDNAGIMSDGRPYASARGLAQLTPWIFDQYRPEGTSTDIYDPIASIAALWRFIADQFNVDLTTGRGLSEFHEFWLAHQTDWWWLTELSPWRTRLPGY
ncbi:hypothetical protein ACNQR7_32545 [Mycolicibacterium senegalense]|uniref:hypothetical protein n=1 Tax=Mycolicibacterium senegalense TaxID=1796 RepID=UPI003AAFE51F